MPRIFTSCDFRLKNSQIDNAYQRCPVRQWFKVGFVMTMSDIVINVIMLFKPEDDR